MSLQKFSIGESEFESLSRVHRQYFGGRKVQRIIQSNAMADECLWFFRFFFSSRVHRQKILI